ncbi:MAG: DUF4062 domain-containing protein [Deltaproteobacteria bacterium]|nr:DUF4062 domain-containing protein [Deltaproteobacteria bacterium]
MTTSPRPRVFISSTIYDFADLRSAAKYWLEESGYEVAASEFNDFPKDVERNSYDACLASIDSCQYFILLIGARAGGRVASPPNTTITMAEYRYAYERAKEGKLKIVALVRRSVWTAREDRSALAELIKDKYQQEHGLSDDDIANLKHHRSKIVVEADTIFGFISEVARAAEMRAAAKDPSAPLPVNNWVHTFENFRDIIDVLRASFVRVQGLRRAALLANMRQELGTNLATLLGREKGILRPYYVWASKAREQFSGGPDDTSEIREIDLMNLAVFGYTASSNLLTYSLDDAIASGEFLHFDATANRYTVGDLHQALLDLRKAITSVKSVCSGFLTAERRAELLEFKKYRSASARVSISNVKIGLLMVLHDQTRNTVQLSLALLRYIETGEYTTPELSPITPFKDHEPELRSGRPTLDELVEFALGQASRRVAPLA